MFSIIKELKCQPNRFSYIQALRILRWHGNSKDFLSRRVRTRAELSLGFPTNDITDCHETEEKFYLTTTFLGLYGIASPLPTFYTEELFDESNDDSSINRDFYDLLTQPFFDQYFQAWEKYRLLPTLIEKNDTEFLDRLFSFLGLNINCQDESHEEAFELLPYSGLFSQLPRSVEGLHTLIDSLTGESVRVDIYQWLERWIEIPYDQRCYLGLKNSQLGYECYLGEKIKDCNYAIRINLHVYDHDTFMSLLPGESIHQKLQRFLRAYIQDSLEVELCLSIDNEVRKAPVLNSENSFKLGLNTWLNGKPDNLIMPLNYN